MAFYIIFYLGISSLAFFFERYRHIIFLAIMEIALFLLSALRFDMGWDYPMYYFAVSNFDYEGLPHGASYVDSDRFDFGIRILQDMAIWLNAPWFFFAATSAIVVLFTYKGIIKSKYPAIALLLLLSYPHFFFDSFCYIRQWCAAVVAFYSYHFLLSKEIKKYIVLILFASLLHISALMLLILILIKNIKVSTKVMLLSAVISFVFADIIANFLANFNLPFIWYIKYALSAGTLGGSIGYLNFATLIVLSYIRCKKNVSREFELFYTISYIGMCSTLLFRDFGQLPLRLHYYFMLPMVLILPEILDVVNRKILTFLSMLAVIGILMCYTVYSMGNIGVGGLVPYKTIFEAPNNMDVK